jgi:hypothetical protein
MIGFFCFSFGLQDFLVTPPMFDEGNLAPTTKKENHHLLEI